MRTQYTKCEPNDSVFTGATNYGHVSGLTKREYFAAMAMQGFMANDYRATPETFAMKAVQMADALIAALNKEAQP